jgi:putative transposase
MPRKARIDAPGALHHIIARGMPAKRYSMMMWIGIFSSNGSVRLCRTVRPNAMHGRWFPIIFHLLFKTGATPIAIVMKRLLTGYAMRYNRRHKRFGHLFQNRYKSILYQEDSYLPELVRYIHLNPLRAGLVADMKALDRYAYCGHSVLMGRVKGEWQNTTAIVRLFDDRLATAKHRYKTFVKKGIADGKW